MDRNLIMSYGFLIVVALSMVVLLMLATPFGDFIGESYVRTVRGGKDVVDVELNEGFQDKTDEFNEMMNEGMFINYIDPGIYEKGVNYNNAHYEAPFEILTSDWEYMLRNKLCYLDEAVLRTRYSKDTNTNQSSDYLNGDIVINAAVLSLDENCFAECKNISSVYLKETQIINKNAFKNCSKLKTLYLSTNSLKYVMKDAFAGTKLTDIYYNGTIAQFNEIKWEKFGTHSVTIHCTDGEFQHNI